MHHDEQPSNRRLFRPLLVLTATTLAGASLWLGPAPAEEPGADAKEAATARARFTMLPSNHMVLRAMLNGKGPYRLIFDLGAPITLLSNKAAETSGTVDANAPKSFLFSMRGEAVVAKLQVGGLTAEKLPVVVFDHPALGVLSDVLGEPIDGIIGFTFFARYRTTIDYQKDEMTFTPVDFEIRDLMKDLPDRIAGPKIARKRVLAPGGLWGLRLGAAEADGNGVRIASVVPDSPAALAGLAAGDVLTAVDDRWTATVHDVYAAAASVEPGREAPVAVRRDGQEHVLTVRPADGA
ncbi:PDZ domain-containing protein [Planctomyces sp. SH-PL62]|uniref:PDZ domain-containing protein n=1 Tax=Planctomyces sp. SH-PL62 TaxID=1636152 RepID=UPI00078CD1F0|nr:PDZ domain-containing protein [Planctomyces sp. SH-PL62]AMV40816.1 serine endoprotease [Planctomyces sp. SH-PL62]